MMLIDIEGADHPDSDGRYRVIETGPEPLWERVEEAVAIWRKLGSPAWERFGITAGLDRQYVWYDRPTARTAGSSTSPATRRP